MRHNGIKSDGRLREVEGRGPSVVPDQRQGFTSRQLPTESDDDIFVESTKD